MGRHHKCPESRDLFGDLCRAIGERVVIVIRGDGRRGVFRGVLAAVRNCDVRLVLTPHDKKPCDSEETTTHILRGGDAVTIPICQIAALARVR